MAALAHIRKGALIATFPTGRGIVHCENGDKASPPVAGYVNGNDRVVLLVKETVGSGEVGSQEAIVDDDRVVIRTTMRAKTQDEIDQDERDFQDVQEGKIAERGIIRALFRAAFIQENRIRALEGKRDLTAEQFRAWVKSQL